MNNDNNNNNADQLMAARTATISTGYTVQSHDGGPNVPS